MIAGQIGGRLKPTGAGLRDDALTGVIAPR